MAVVARKSGTKMVHLARLQKILFSPKRTTLKKTKQRVEERSKTAADAILTKLHDEKNQRTNTCQALDPNTRGRTAPKTGRMRFLEQPQLMIRPRARWEDPHLRYRDMVALPCRVQQPSVT